MELQLPVLPVPPPSVRASSQNGKRQQRGRGVGWGACAVAIWRLWPAIRTMVLTTLKSNCRQSQLLLPAFVADSHGPPQSEYTCTSRLCSPSSLRLGARGWQRSWPRGLEGQEQVG